MSSTIDPRRPRICLNMIVKNESAVIERYLTSVRSHIDAWVIVDTGSSDDTREKIIELRQLPVRAGFAGFQQAAVALGWSAARIP